MAGYSGTPLPQKLGIEEGHEVALIGEPAGFDDVLGTLPTGAVVQELATRAKQQPLLDVIRKEQRTK